MADVDQLLTKKVGDRYLKRGLLGEGTYGVVNKAIDTKVLRLLLFHVFRYFNSNNSLFFGDNLEKLLF